VIALEDLYFEWLLSCIDPDGVKEGVAHIGGLLHNCEFHRRVGNDINRAVEGADLRKEFFLSFSSATFNDAEIDSLLMKECTWLEMLIALARHLDYTYDEGVDTRFYEMINNMGLWSLTDYSPNRSRRSVEYDQHLVDKVTSAIDHNQFKSTGEGGIFPLHKPRQHDHDQREVEIWDQCAAYFRERLEGVLWTSTT
jgi:hypothetical protein